jgi:hypothetical protein
VAGDDRGEFADGAPLVAISTAVIDKSTIDAIAIIPMSRFTTHSCSWQTTKSVLSLETYVSSVPLSSSLVRILADLDMDEVWAEASERERRVLVENLLKWIKVFPDYLAVNVR